MAKELLVSVSTGAMGSLLEKLGTMLSDEYELLKGVRDDINFLKAELEAMQVFLIVMAEEEKPDKQAKLRADAVREMSYEIEDSIDKFMILLEHEPSSQCDGFWKLFNICKKKITDIKISHKIAKEFKGIKSQVEEENKRYKRYKIDKSSKSENAKVDPRILAVYKDAAELVGIDGPTNELLKWLSDKEGKSAHQLKVVSIVGYGGLGKTTLAKQVYDKLGANFECRAFVSISRNPDMTKILSSIFSQIQNKGETHAGLGEPQLIIDQIRNFLKDKRYFIIIDDVWDIQTWQVLDCALVKNGCGSVLMTTTRIHDVAKSCCSSLGDLVYKIQPLGAANSKKLFFKRIFGCEENCLPHLKEVSKDILKKCGGLPLAINTISSLLATRKTKEEWGRVRNSIGFTQGKNPEIEAMNYILSLSYIDLPLYLRSCLLYLTLFPEDYDIRRRRLVHRWISEGFIYGEDGQDLVELGETYFHDLVNRSLIQPVDIGRDGKAKSCRVHDTILDFLLYKSTEENFCTMLSNHSKPDSGVVRRLSLMGNEDKRSVEQLDLSHARSLGTFGPHILKYLPSLAKSNALRVLDLQECWGLARHVKDIGRLFQLRYLNISGTSIRHVKHIGRLFQLRYLNISGTDIRHVKDIGRLFQLRYLNISGTGITELPGQIENLKYLETLDASYSELIELPKSVTRLKRLARLFVRKDTKLPDGIGDMENLQELGNCINIFVQSVNFLEELGKLKNLRKLTINWVSYVEFDEECYKEKRQSIVLSLYKLDKCKLHDLRIEFDLTKKDATFIAPPFFPAVNSIRKILLRTGQLCWITKWMLSLVNLEILVIKNEKDIELQDVEMVEPQDVEMVGSIPNLLQFRLYAFRVGPIIIRGGFQQLQELRIGLGVKVWMFEAGAMPNLKNLFLQIGLYEFKNGGIDWGIQHLSSLASLRVDLDCDGSTTADVEAFEGGLKSMVDAHPNRPTLTINRILDPSERAEVQGGGEGPALAWGQHVGDPQEPTPGEPPQEGPLSHSLSSPLPPTSDLEISNPSKPPLRLTPSSISG